VTGGLHITAAAYQNEYLPDGGDRADVVVRVSVAAEEGQIPAGAAHGEFIILIDCSGSMDAPRAKLSEARRAAVAALRALRDGVSFALIAGSERARLVYPEEPGLAVASETTRDAAIAAANRLRASGGTAIGRWLTLANELFSTRDGVARHAILLTDGKNENETAEQLDTALTACRGRFRCDCRVTGAAGGEHGWSAQELLKISQALSGNVENVEEPANLPANLAQAAVVATERSIVDLRLRVRVAQGTEMRYLKQVHPTLNDLTGRRVGVDPHTADYSTGPWGAEQRDYQFAFTFAPRPAGAELRVAWVSLVLAAGSGPADEVAEVPIWARWTRDLRESTRMNPQVAHYTGQTELATAIQDGIEAYKERRLDAAQQTLGRAVALAHQSRQTDQVSRLAQLVEIEDPERGLVRLRPDIDPIGIESALLESVRTSGFSSGPDPEPVTPVPYGELCPRCGTPRIGRYCEQDGYDFAPRKG
jgi:von Willebrand factor type A domain